MSEKMKFPGEKGEERKSFRQSMREEAALHTPMLQGLAESYKALMQDEKIRSFISPEDLEILERSERVWNVDVIGKLKAYEKGKSNKYRLEAEELIKEIGPILRAALDALIEKKLQDWGMDLDDNETWNKMTRSTQKSVSLLCTRILDGRMSLKDIDEVVSKAAAEISEPKE